jgi:hypothetical protein
MTNRAAGDRSFNRLRAFNLVAGVLHAIQATAILLLSNDFALPVTGTFMEGPPGQAPLELSEWFDIRIGPAVAAFLYLSALAHFIIASPGVFGWYRRQLERNRNYARWVEYSLSASLMIVLIAMLTGISDVAALLALFGVNASMILFGWLQEKYEEPGSGGWLPFWFGCLAGAVPWVAIGIYILSPTTDAQAPGFVIGIFVSLFVFFNVFALNQVLQYRQSGPWRNYLFGEAAYIVLSLTAKSALAWQVFFPTLID